MFSPNIKLYAEGGSAGDCQSPVAPTNFPSAGGPFTLSPGPCQPPRVSGFHWEESNPNKGGYYKTIALVDDRPELARRICFEVANGSTAASDRYEITETVVDPDGSRRTKSYGLAPQDVSPTDCSPVAVPPTPVNDPAPPSWWLEGRSVLLKRGGKCASETTQVPGDDPTTGRPGGASYSEVEVNCTQGAGKRLSVCSRGFSNGNARGDEYFFLCGVYSPRPRPSVWCERKRAKGPAENDNNTTWLQRDARTRHPRGFPKRLSTCLKRRFENAHHRSASRS